VHTIKGHGICKLATEARDAPEKDISVWEQEIKMYNIEYVPQSTSTTLWYEYLQ